MRIFVAGATGVIGRALLPLLTDAGHEVTAATRNPDRAELLRSLGAEPVVVDVFDRDGVVEAVQQVRPEAIVHQLTDLTGGDLASNARLREVGTRHLVEGAGRAGVRRMVAQSIAWALPPNLAAADESTPLDTDDDERRATTVRGVRALESAVGELEAGVVLRYGHLYGPKTMWAGDGRFGELMRAGTPPMTDAVLPFVQVQDAARAAADALAWPAGTYHVVDDEPAELAQWLPVYAAAVGAAEPAVPEPSAPGWRLPNTKARAQGLTLRHPTWREGFATL